MRKNESQLPRGLLCCDSMPKEPLTCWVRTNYPAAAKLGSQISEGIYTVC